MAITVEGQHHNVFNKPFDFTGGGHYHIVHQCAIVNTQAAASKLFEVRNPSATVVIVPTRLQIQWLQTGTHTAAIEDSLDVYKVTGFTVSATANKVDLVPTVARTSSMVAVPATGVVKGVTVAGASAGMTGQTLTKSTAPVETLAQWLLAAQPTTAQVFAMVSDWYTGMGECPLVLETNEGLVVENRVLLGAAAASSVYIKFSYVEVNLANF